MPRPQAAILVTGANGHLGRHLIRALGEDPDPNGVLRAAVRSQRAAAQVRATPGGSDLDIRILDYTDQNALRAAANGCRAVVHFVGVIKQSRDTRYEDAHERSCESLARAAQAAGVERIVYLSILGARPDSENPCLASKGRAEKILRDGSVPTCVLRVPMVLGAEDHASRSLRAQATARILPLIGGGKTLQQPIDAADVIAAVRAALRAATPLDISLDLGGPECLSHRELVRRAAKLFAKSPTVLPIPIAAVRAVLGPLEALGASPPVTCCMLDVLQHDDRVDTEQACKKLGIDLTALDDTLRCYVGPSAGEE